MKQSSPTVLGLVSSRKDWRKADHFGILDKMQRRLERKICGMICIWAAQFLAALWTFLSLACLQAHAQGTPRIQFDRTVFDFGRTSQVQQLRGKFIVRNAGDATLQLDKPVSSCGCLSAELSAQTVQPGGRAELNFSINLAAGRQLLAKQINIGSNDPRQPQSTVEVRVENIPLYDLDPMWVNLADMRKGDAASFEVSIHRTDGKKLGL